MRLNTDHFHGQQSLIPDDVFKTIVQESDCLNQVQTKRNIEWRKILERIEYLCIDITHFKKTKKIQPNAAIKWTRSTTKRSRRC